MAGEIVFYKNIIENMQEGVMTLDLQGKVTMFNDTAALILGMPQEDVLDQSFGMIFMMEMEDNDEFNQVILDAVYESAMGKKQIVEFKRPDNTLVHLSLSTSYIKSGQAPARDQGQEQDRSGVIVVFNDITKIVKFQKSERQLNQQLQKAVLESEETNKTLSSALKKVKVIQISIVVMILLAGVGGGGYLWHMDTLSDSFLSTDSQIPQTMGIEGMQPYTVSSQPVSNSVSLSGYVAPLEEINIVAPFDGKIKEKFFVYDQKTQKEDLLLKMDTSKLKISLREHKSSYIKARQRYNEVANWDKSTEVSRAKRSFIKAKSSLTNTKRKLEETKLLFEKGIIPASELKTSEIEYFNQSLDFTAVQEELDGVLKKGDKENLDIAQFEMENATVNLKEIEEKLGHAVVFSPVSGIVIQPTLGGDSKNKSIEAGTSVSQGEILFTIGNLEGISIKAKVDEIDIGQIQFGQEVIVQGDAFANIPLTGKVSHISSNAVGSQGQAPAFDVTVTIASLTQVQKQKIKLGMSTNLEIMVYQNSSALLIPLTAVEIQGDKKWVKTLDPATGELAAVEVETGMTTMDSVEILEGLKENDTIYFELGPSGSMPSRFGSAQGEPAAFGRSP